MEKPNQLSGTDGGYGISAVTPSAEPNTDQDIRQLRTEISENQAQLQETVAEIQERLSPAHLKEQATTAVPRRHGRKGPEHDESRRGNSRANTTDDATSSRECRLWRRE